MRARTLHVGTRHAVSCFHAGTRSHQGAEHLSVDARRLSKLLPDAGLQRTLVQAEARLRAIDRARNYRGDAAASAASAAPVGTGHQQVHGTGNAPARSHPVLDSSRMPDNRRLRGKPLLPE